MFTPPLGDITTSPKMLMECGWMWLHVAIITLPILKVAWVDSSNCISWYPKWIKLNPKNWITRICLHEDFGAKHDNLTSTLTCFLKPFFGGAYMRINLRFWIKRHSSHGWANVCDNAEHVSDIPLSEKKKDYHNIIDFSAFFKGFFSNQLQLEIYLKIIKSKESDY